MSARRSSRQSVSLFEFLAVLMCTMGALILFLLVTTRKIRQQALAEAEAAIANVPEMSVQAPTGAAVLLAVPEGDAPTWLMPETIWEPAPEPEVLEIDPYLEAQRQNEALRLEWEANVHGLELQWAALQQNWDEWQATLIAAERAIANLQSLRQQREDQSQALSRQQQMIELQHGQLTQSQAMLRQRIDATAAELEAARSAPEPAASRFAILPYDYSAGTTRRPIIIECTEDEIRFASEGVVLTPGDMQGFSPAFNPLEAGASALVDYWSRQDVEAGSNGDPYILIVVRPSGTISYYIARKLLEDVGDHFGYELVGEDQEFVWPETTPEAVRGCREAVEARLGERDRLIGSVGGGNLPVAGPLQFMDDSGNFFLEEVAELRSVQADVAANPNGSPDLSRAGSDERDLSAIFGDAIYDETPGGNSRPPVETEPDDRERRSLFGPRHASDQTGDDAPARESTDAAGHQSDAGSAPPPSQNGAAPPPGGSNAPSGAQLPPQMMPSEPTWIERPRGPDDSPSFETHPGLFGMGRSNPSATSSEPSGSPRPLVIETGSPSFGASGSDVAPAPVVHGTSADAERDPIGYQRDLYVYIDGTSFQVAGENAVPLRPDMTREEAARLLSESLRSQMATWEAPPAGGQWVPRVRFEIRRGGNAYLRQMTHIVSEWRINWTANYIAE